MEERLFVCSVPRVSAAFREKAVRMRSPIKHALSLPATMEHNDPDYFSDEATSGYSL